MKSFIRPFVFVAKWVRKHWKLSLFVVILLGIGGFIAMRRFNQPEEQLTFVPVQQGDLIKTINVSGIVDAKQKASLHYATAAKVTYIGAKEGDPVKRWQTLARIDVADQQKRMQQDLNNYFNQRMVFEQNADDRGDTILSDELGRQAQQDQKALENAVLDVEIRDIAIRNAALTSPIAGILVSAPSIVPGVVINPTDIFEVVDPNSLLFKAAVDETDIDLVQKGQQATIELDAYPDEPISATVSAISYRSSQSASGTVFVVELPLTNTGTQSAIERYRLGMNGDTDIIVDQRKDVLQIPIDSLIERDDKKYARRRTGENSAEEVEIQTGIENEEMIEVVSGLSAGDEVVAP